MEKIDDSFCRRLWGNLNWCFVYSPKIESAGGLVSTWDLNYLNILNNFITKRFIALICEINGRNQKIGLVNVYGPSTDAVKKEFFTDVSNMISSYDTSWVIGGEFNAYLYLDEKIGSSCNNLSMAIFKEFIQHV
ncbi:hypothetical protein V6N11_051899 [Hibiscus sabdariffa]|uniref:Endonuclease/exonuclease/phosphatase domain-containing protein n=1 Tax=Hibiscus sabdariffa TaxID=183260 RepID=A0ABR2U8V5_9ROSI